MDKLFSDLKTDLEKANFFLSGRGYETGVIAQAIQNDVAMSYSRCDAAAAEPRRLEEAHDWQYKMAGDRLRRIEKLEAVNAQLLEALSSIDVYLSDTLSGRVKPDPATYKQWLIDGIIEARNRARAAIAAAKGEACT